jgi:hypothetical protein
MLACVNGEPFPSALGLGVLGADPLASFFSALPFLLSMINLDSHNLFLASPQPTSLGRNLSNWPWRPLRPPLASHPRRNNHGSSEYQRCDTLGRDM